MNPLARKILLHVLIPLIAGFLLYFFWRPGYWFVRLFGDRQPLIPVTALSDWQKGLVFSGPDLCWAYSFSSALFIWEKWQGLRWKRFAWLVGLLILFSELVQLFLGNVFTFDPWDLAAAGLAFLLSYLFVYEKEQL